ncbi:MAG: 4Fe-4S dicluster domain-containing protein [Nitrososphaerota archaeon]|nr:4Fe-4S dicluster domain-containing protein [Nitrososphaerota archaeon]MDG7023822.1 4Fe-4S dicluster domain-containing protein [Nitrososphaerota archaeon]
MTRYGMVVDLNRCVACTGCVAACAVYHNLPNGILWNKVVYSEEGRFPGVRRLQMPKACQQCDNTPCVKVCPTGATYKRADGIVMVDYSKCIGCKYCVAACPYDARSFLANITPWYDSGFTSLENLSPNQQAGVAQKCTFCADKIDAGVKAGSTPGVDRNATPACVNTCPVGARYFGDLDDPNSNVSQIIASSRAQQLLPDLGTQPKVYYIPLTKSVTAKGVLPT